MKPHGTGDCRRIGDGNAFRPRIELGMTIRPWVDSFAVIISDLALLESTLLRNEGNYSGMPRRLSLIPT